MINNQYPSNIVYQQGPSPSISTQAVMGVSLPPPVGYYSQIGNGLQTPTQPTFPQGKYQKCNKFGPTKVWILVVVLAAEDTHTAKNSGIDICKKFKLPNPRFRNNYFGHFFPNVWKNLGKFLESHIIKNFKVSEIQIFINFVQTFGIKIPLSGGIWTVVDC